MRRKREREKRKIGKGKTFFFSFVVFLLKKGTNFTSSSSSLLSLSQLLHLPFDRG